MGFLEKTGKNVDEALEQALNELKTTRDKVNIEVCLLYTSDAADE